MPFTTPRKRPEIDSKTGKAHSEQSYPAREATPIEITDSIPMPVLPPHIRPRSSYYSQASISYSSFGFPERPTSIVPPVPRLTSAALLSLEERFGAASNKRSETENYQYYGTHNPWQHQYEEPTMDDDDKSPVSPKNRTVKTMRRVSVDAYLSAIKHTPISQYLRDRTWIPETPAIPGDQHVHASRPSRRHSIRRSFSDMVDQTVRKASTPGSNDNNSGYAPPVGNPENRKSILTARPARRKSSVSARPYLFEEDYRRSEHTNGRTPAARPMGPRPQPHSSRSRQARSVETVESRPSKNIDLGVPYEETRRGPTPIPITSIWAANSRQSHKTPAKVRPQIMTTYKRMTPTSSQYSETPVSAAPSYLSYSRCNNPLSRMYPRPSVFSQTLQTRTRDPLDCSEQGSFLFIGTLRGPTPAGLRTLHDAMDKAIAKYGEIEGAFKGCKEVRKWLRHEDRSVIEWTLAYVRGRWGVEV